MDLDGSLKLGEIAPETGGAKMQLWNLVLWALTNKAQEIEMIPLNYYFKDAARQNDKRPAYLSFFAPDEWVKNLTKNEKLLDAFVVVKITREDVQQHIMEQQIGRAKKVSPEESVIVQP